MLMDDIVGANSHELQSSKREEKSRKINIITSQRPAFVGPESWQTSTQREQMQTQKERKLALIAG